jgi:hypothetical protein
MSVYPDIGEMVLRGAAIIQEVFPNAEVSTDPLFAGETFPYFVVRAGAITDGVTADDESEELDGITVNMIVRHVIGHITQGYRGETAVEMYSEVGLLLNTFHSRDLLQSATYPEAMLHIDEARFVSGAGFAVIESSGIGVMQVGTEHVIRCEFTYGNEQDY